jgi:hypothetical protein
MASTSSPTPTGRPRTPPEPPSRPPARAGRVPDQEPLADKQWDMRMIDADFPPGAAYPRDVNNSCITVPTETRGVISVSALGPSGYKADCSNDGIEQTDFSAPGGWFRDFFGLPQNRRPENENLSTMPQALAEEALQNPANVPFILKDCKAAPAPTTSTCRAPRRPRPTPPGWPR